jgi:hypothetical protein
MRWMRDAHLIMNMVRSRHTAQCVSDSQTVDREYVESHVLSLTWSRLSRTPHRTVTVTATRGTCTRYARSHTAGIGASACHMEVQVGGWRLERRTDRPAPSTTP